MTTKRPAPEDDPDRVRLFPKKEEICVWMIAGVVNFKLCNHQPGCQTCPFDEAMRKAWNQNCREENT